MLFSQQLNIHKIFKPPAKALIRLRVCAGCSEPLLVSHTRLLRISCHGLNNELTTTEFLSWNRQQPQPNCVNVCVLCLFLVMPWVRLPNLFNVSPQRTIKERKKEKIRKQYNQVPHLTKEIIWESKKNTGKHHIQGSQEVSHFPAGEHKSARDIQDSMTKTSTKHK